MSINLDEICNGLQSTERRPKLAALEQLQQQCEKAAPSQLHDIFDHCYLHLLKGYSDRFESVRDETVQTVTKFVENLPPNDFHLLNIVATLAERMGQQETIEPSEEIRLLYVKQLLTLIQQYVSTGNGRSLQECYAEIVRILVKALRDSYPAVQRESCACVVTLACAADTCALQPWVEKLVKPLYGMLNHKHSVARIAAVDAIGRLALHINANGEALSQLLMEVSPLLMDSMPLVRRECGELGIRLALELRDRYSYFARIIPFVLCCLKDDSPEVVDYIRPLWVQCGKQYYDENEMELSKQDVVDLPVANYPEGVERPTIGCRGIVQRSLRLLRLITRESGDWKENVRLHSLKLLYQFVLHAERSMTAKFFEIYAEVARACRDTEPIVANEALKVADLMGRLLEYDDWREDAFEGLERNSKEGYLKCFYQMFNASLGPKLDDLVRVAKMLIDRAFTQSLKAETQLYVLKMVRSLLNKSRELKDRSTENELKQLLEVCTELEAFVYISTMKVMSVSVDSEQINAIELQELGNEILCEIAERQQISVGVLHEKYFISVLDHVEDLDARLDELTEPILMLHGLIIIAKFRSTYLKCLQEKINMVWKYCEDGAKVKIFSGISISMLHWTSTIDRDVNESTQLLREFVAAVVEENLQWRAGANAENMRSLATATLCSMSQGAAEEAREVLPTLAKYMPSLLEDRAVSIRHYAIKCLFNFGELSVEELKPVAYSALQRFDDPSGGIRELAAMVIPKLCPKFKKAKSDDTDYEYDIWETFIKKALDMMFLHYESPEVRLQKAIKGSITQLAEKYPQLCKDCYKRIAAMSYNSISLLELQSELPILA